MWAEMLLKRLPKGAVLMLEKNELWLVLENLFFGKAEIRHGVFDGQYSVVNHFAVLSCLRFLADPRDSIAALQNDSEDDSS